MKIARKVNGFLVSILPGNFRRCAELFMLCAGLFCLPVHGAIYSWSGGGGANAYWNNSANWGFAGIPTNGDTLIFSASQPDLVNTNNISGLTLNQIRFVGAGGGYDIRGNAFTITNNIEATNSTGANTIENNIALANADQIVDVAASLTLSGILSGSVGLVKNGTGTLLLNGLVSNSYGGTTTVNGGTVQLAKANFPPVQAIPGNLVIGNGTNAATVQNIYGLEFVTTANVTVNLYCTWDLNGNSESINTNLTLNGGTVQTESGALTLSANPTVTSRVASSTINGNLQLVGSATMVASNNLIINANISSSGNLTLAKTGSQFLYLSGTNSYTGTNLVQQGWMYIYNGTALGAASNSTIVSNGATLALNGNFAVTNALLTLNGPGEPEWAALDSESSGTNIWAGPITMTADSTFGNYDFGALRIIGPISGAGGANEVYGVVSFEGSTANTYAGTTTVSVGTLVLDKSYGIAAVPGNLAIEDGATARLANDEQTVTTADVFVDGGGLFDFSTFYTYMDTLHGTGTVNFGSLGYIYLGLNNGSSEFDGSFTGIGYSTGFTVGKTGSGTFTIGGNSTYTAGSTVVYNGKLVINGSQPKIPVTVESTTTLGGSGTVGTLFAAGVISPGNSPGILNSSNVTFSSTGNYTVELTGPNPGAGGYDQLNVTGTVSLANATLTVVPAFTTPVAIGQQFIIVNNDLSDAITGTFSGLTQGSSITVGGYTFNISYIGGTGNDVVLTLTSIPGAVTGSAVTSGDGSHGIDPNGCNNLALAITDTTGTPMTGVNATLSTTTEGVVITQPYATYPDIAASGSGTNIAPFQISTLTNFACGTPINLQLSVDSSLGSFTMNYTLVSGEPAAPLRYDVTGNVSIPDVGTVDSTNVVSGFTGTPLQKVTVSLYITHPFDSDLTNISLISPDGTTVLLSSANGGGGQNYGSGLTPDSNRTTFDDGAATAITAGAAPFTGTYRPQSPLSAFINNATPNGGWHLHIADGFGGSLGTLRGWSLFLYGTGCSTGSGSCDYCLTSINGAITNTDLIQTNRISRDHNVASCGLPKPYPGAIGGTYYYDAYAFTNPSTSDACVSVVLSSSTNVQAIAYLGNFDPSNIASNYLGDAGFSTGPGNIDNLNGPTTFSVTVPAGANFFICVNQSSSVAFGSYTLQLSGLPCPPPTLTIQPVTSSQAHLYWPTWAGGYLLESDTNLTSSSWSTITNEPIIGGINTT
jgi:autotransporter-associated beta strand protein